MRKQYLVQTLGYWGRGLTIKEAAQSCFRAGAIRRNKCIVEVFTHPTEDPSPEINWGGLMVSYREGSTKESVMNQVTLGKLLLGKA
jgi:hypothetical protein